MRKTVDCRDYPSEVGCTLRISGEEEEVVRAATEHAASVHGEADSFELREEVRRLLKDEGEPDHPELPSRKRPTRAAPQ